MVILTHLEKGRKDGWKLSTPQLLQKPLTITSQDLPTKKNNTNPTGDAAGEKNVRSLFPAPCWKVFFFASRKQFIL